jgi:two-component system copper resistance phosphate regulon response regulator CusR
MAGNRRRDGQVRTGAWRNGRPRPPSRTRRRQPAIVRIADAVIDLDRQRATRAGTPLALTSQDFTLLALLVGEMGNVVTRERLAREIWQRTHDDRSNFVEVGIWRLRAKFDEPHGRKLIHSVRGIGYVLAVAS